MASKNYFNLIKVKRIDPIRKQYSATQDKMFLKLATDMHNNIPNIPISECLKMIIKRYHENFSRK